MKKILTSLILASFFYYSAGSLAQDKKINEKEMLSLINEGSGNAPLYETKDIPLENRNQFDFNSDGFPEWAIRPQTSCGETHNCTFFILQVDSKKKKWKRILKADGKLTSLSPWGLIIVPHSTKGYRDIITVFDLGPEPNGDRSLERTHYLWNGKQYEKYTRGYPPSGSSSDLINFMKEVDKLKYERVRMRTQ